MFSTGPQATTTHWKQATLYLSDSFEVKKGQTLTGTLAFNKHHTNKRALKLNLKLVGDGINHQQQYDML